MDMKAPILDVRFFATDSGNEPVREWLKTLPASERRTIGEDIKTVQFGWPLGMPLVRKLAKDLWEIRIHLMDRIARVLFTVVSHTMVLLHGFIKTHPTKNSTLPSGVCNNSGAPHEQAHRQQL